MRKICAAVGVMLVLSGCAPAKLVPMSRPQETNQSTLVVYRESAFNAGGIDAVFGSGKQDWVALGTKSYAVLQIAPAPHEFFVRSTQADQPFVFKAALARAETKCLRVFPNSGNIAKALLPISYLAGNTFFLEETACPTPEALAGFGKKDVTYAK
jgi:hypothetical protein